MKSDLYKVLRKEIASDQTAVFETAADLFSVLALAAIFAAIVYGATLTPSESTPLTKPEYGERAGAAIPETLLMVTITDRDDSRGYIASFQLGSRSFTPQSISEADVNDGAALTALLGRIDDFGKMDQKFTKILCLVNRPKHKDMRLDGFFLDLVAGLKEAGYDDISIAVQ